MKPLTPLIALLLTLLAGCATTPPPTAPAPSPTPSQAPVPQATPKTPELKKETLALLAKRKLTPISGRALNARASCSFRDAETGYRGQLELAVTNAAVEQLNARVDVPNRGSCQFRLADFHQTDTLPIVVLASRQSSCKVSLWEQGSQVTVAFRDCRAECGGDAVDYLWPILVDSQKGSCS
jgi:hypothetical protein